MSSKELQIVVPMAGRGSRFAREGYELPKPLIDVAGRPMIDVVVSNLKPSCPHRFLFVVQSSHVADHSLDVILRDASPGCSIIQIDHVTQGAACTVLEARQMLDSSAPLMIANCDQWVDASIDDYLNAFRSQDVDGFMMVMPETDPKWSFASVDSDGWVTRVVEKEPISDIATVGIYNFSRAGSFTAAADSMISAGRSVNNEFYVAPVYNEMIEFGARVATWNVESEGPAMYGLGTPADLERFLSAPPRSFASVPAGRAV